MRRILTLCLVLTGLSAHAQYTAKSIVFHGGAPYTNAQLQSSFALKTGVPFTADDLQKAAQQLIDTGAFEELQPQLTGPFRSITVDVTLKPVADDKLLPAEFENIVWFSSKDLDTGLHQRVPLYTGRLPEAGNLQEQVRAALVAMLAEKGVTTTVAVMEVAPSPNHPVSSFAFSIEKPQIFLQSVALEGISAEMSNDVTGIIRAAIGKPYYESGNASVLDPILGAYRNNGYLDAKIEGLQRTPTSTEAKVDVRITGTLLPGEPYRVKSIAWSGSPQISAADFEAKNKLHAGDIASQKQLRESINLIQKAFQHQGYLFAEIDPQPTLDHTAHTVAYAFAVKAGEQYRLRSIRINGLPPAQEATVIKNWKMNPGDLYDPEYVVQFMQKNTALQFLAAYNARFETKSDAASKQADVIVTFNSKHAGYTTTVTAPQ